MRCVSSVIGSTASRKKFAVKNDVAFYVVENRLKIPYVSAPACKFFEYLRRLYRYCAHSRHYHDAIALKVNIAAENRLAAVNSAVFDHHVGMQKGKIAVYLA